MPELMTDQPSAIATVQVAEPAPTEQPVQAQTDPSKMTQEQLAEALNGINLPNHDPWGAMIPEMDEPPAQSDEQANQPQQPQPPAQEPQANAEPPLPFTSKEELEKGYRNIQELIGKQSRELGELRRFKETASRQSQPQQPQPQPQPVQQQQDFSLPEDFDPLDAKQLASVIDSRAKAIAEAMVKTTVEPHLQDINSLKAMKEQEIALAEENRFRSQAQELSSDSMFGEEFKIQSNLDDVLDVITAAQQMGKNPSEVHPEAAKVMKIVDLVRQVKGSNGVFSNLKEAYLFNLAKSGDLQKRILDASKNATIQTVQKINDKRNASPPTISGVGGQAPAKGLKQLSQKELDEYVNKIADSEEEAFRMNRAFGLK